MYVTFPPTERPSLLWGLRNGEQMPKGTSGTEQSEDGEEDVLSSSSDRQHILSLYASQQGAVCISKLNFGADRLQYVILLPKKSKD